MTKKSLLMGAMLMVSSALMAQSSNLYISSYSAANVEKCDGQTKNVTMSREMFKGWNTLCLPVSLTAEEVKAAFGDDCKLEALQGVTANGNTYYLDFQNATEVKANIPYLVYYAKENGVAKIKANDAKVEYVAEPKQTFNVAGATISLVGATKIVQAEGLYGIYAKDNAEAKFVNVDVTNSAFPVTRCYITATGVENPVFVATHNAVKPNKNDKKSRLSVSAAEKSSDAVYNINGMQMKSAGKGVSIINGKKYTK